MQKFILIILLATVFSAVVFAQNTSSKNPKTLEDLMEKVNKIKEEKKGDTKTKSDNKTANKKPVQKDLTINKKLIDSSYSRLTESEKQLCKNLPPIPARFVTGDDAQNFLDKTKDFSMMGFLTNNKKDITPTLLGYLAVYESVKNKASFIVTQGEKAKAAFETNNPSIQFGKNRGKIYVSSNSVVYLPLAETSFADEVVSANYVKGDLKFDTKNCLGVPDYILTKKRTEQKNVYSLGNNGTLQIKFTNNALVDVNGPDLFVFEEGQVEPTKLEISKDGMNWLDVGKISGGTSFVDIGSVVKPNEYYYYVRLTDLNSQSTVPGADIDAIAAIGAAIKLSLNAEVLFDLGKSVLKPEGIAAVKKFAADLKVMSKGNITIDGYTDDIGSDEANNKLSLDRAKSVSTILQQELKGAGIFTFSENGKGKLQPVAPNTNEENRKKNRRVEIIIGQ